MVPVEQIKRGSFVYIKGRPCCVTKTALLSMGMHGVRKAIVSGEDVLTGKGLEDVVNSGSGVERADVVREEVALKGVAGHNRAELDGRPAADFATPQILATAQELLKQGGRILATVTSVKDERAVTGVRVA